MGKSPQRSGRFTIRRKWEYFEEIRNTKIYGVFSPTQEMEVVTEERTKKTSIYIDR